MPNKQLINRTIWAFGFISIVLSSPVIADDLEDAKSAYGAGQFEEAANLLRPLVRQQNIHAVYLLAKMYEQGDGVKKDFIEAKRLYRISADKGHEAAQQRLDIFNAQGENDSVVIEWYLPSAREGDTEAQYNLGFMYETGWGVSANEEEAVKWYKESAEMQHDLAQLRLGMMNIVGIGTPKNLNKGLDLLRQAALNGNRIAETLIQDLFDVSDIDTESATRIVAGLRRILDQGDAQALATLRKNVNALFNNITEKTEQTTQQEEKPQTQGIALLKTLAENKAETEKKLVNEKIKNAVFVDQSATSEKQFSQYFEAANSGEVDAQFQLGKMYIVGVHTTKDMDEGVHWITIAAEKGHASAVAYMALWREDLRSDAFNSTVAISWLRESGRNWDIDAIFNLAFLYETGRGVEKNFKKAMQWYSFAASEGHAEAKRRAANLKQGGGVDVKENIGNNATQFLNSSTTVMILFFTGCGLVLLLVIGFLMARRREVSDVSTPVLQASNKNKVEENSDSQEIQIDDKRFFDELWEAKPVNKKSAEKTSTDKKEKQAKETPVLSRPEESKTLVSENLKEVEGKLAAAISAMNAKETSLEVEEKTEIDADKRVHAASGVQRLGHVDHAKNQPQKTEEKKVEQEQEASEQKVVALRADAFINDGISSNELAVSRVSADNLFADGVAIDEAGLAVGAGNYSPFKLNADTVLSSADLSFSTSPDQSKPPKQRPTGAAASLLPSQHVRDTQADHFLDAEEKGSVKPVYKTQIGTPFTDEEEKSLAEVHYNIGLMFMNGDGVPKNDSQAAKWYLKAAEEGLPQAQHELGELYLNGKGVPKNTSIGLSWVRKAADNGYLPAQKMLQSTAG